MIEYMYGVGSELQPATSAITRVEALPSIVHNRESSVMVAKEEAREAKITHPIKEAPRTAGKKPK